MFTPLYDGIALKYLRWPIVNYSLILLNVIVSGMGAAGALGDADRLDTALGVIPSVLFGTAALEPSLAWAPAPATLLTGMFLHGGFGHLAGNMLFLWVFGDNVEDAMGSVRYCAFYLACGIAGALCYALALPASESPLIGASAAISGVVCAYMMLYPRVFVFGVAFTFIPLAVPAAWFVGAWIALQAYSALFGGDPEVGWWAHVGGIIAGAALLAVLKRREVALFSGRTD